MLFQKLCLGLCCCLLAGVVTVAANADDDIFTNNGPSTSGLDFGGFMAHGSGDVFNDNGTLFGSIHGVPVIVGDVEFSMSTPFGELLFVDSDSDGVSDMMVEVY